MNLKINGNQQIGQTDSNVERKIQQREKQSVAEPYAAVQDVTVQSTVLENPQSEEENGETTSGLGTQDSSVAGDTVNISQESIDLFKEQMKSARENSSNGLDEMGKMLVIARRISNGDKVPAKDEKKLIEYSPELYQSAKAAAMLHADKKHRKVYKSVFDEEENGQNDQLRELDRTRGNETKRTGQNDQNISGASADIAQESAINGDIMVENANTDPSQS